MSLALEVHMHRQSCTVLSQERRLAGSDLQCYNWQPYCTQSNGFIWPWNSLVKALHFFENVF